MFGDDFFSGPEDFFNQILNNRRNTFEDKTRQPQNILNTIESDKETILIFDLPGEKVNKVETTEDTKRNDYGEIISGMQKILTITLDNNKKLKYILPDITGSRKLSYTFSNGILEVSLKR